MPGVFNYPHAPLKAKKRKKATMVIDVTVFRSSAVSNYVLNVEYLFSHF